MPGTVVTKNLLFIAFLPFMAIACAGGHIGRPAATVRQPEGKNEEFIQKLEERMHEEEEAFKALSDKMDEYQNLMAACESLAETEENRAIKASCKERLKALKEELLNLSDFLRDQPD